MKVENIRIFLLYLPVFKNTSVYIDSIKKEHNERDHMKGKA
jgi:hypothetical protein